MENKTGKYFKYAIGEIVLVVIGILIALSINNWNEQRIKDNELSKTYERLIIDIDNDIRELSRNLAYWKDKEPIFKKVMNDSISADLLDEGLSRLLTSRLTNTNFNKTGVQQLKTLNVKDQLSLRIVEIYDHMEKISIIPYEKKISEQSGIVVGTLRDNYPWFSEYMSKTIMKDNSSKELQDYFLRSMEYKNRVIQGNQTIFVNYVPTLERFIPILENIRAQLTIKTNSNFMAVRKKELEKYEGTYEVTNMERNGVETKNTDIFEISARENFLRVTPVINPNEFTDYFYSKDNTFHNETNGQKVTAVVQVDSASNIIGFITTIESNQDKIVAYISKQIVKNKDQ